MTSSPWPSSSPGADTPVERNLTADIAVVGAGIAGLTTAYVLARQGRKPVVIDAQGPVAAESHATTAHLASVIDDRFVNLESWVGEEFAQIACQSHAAAIDFIEELVVRHRIPCEFKRVDGYLFAPHPDQVPFLRNELAASRRAGHVDAEWLDAAPLPGLRSHPALRFPNQASFNPGIYLNGLLNAVRDLGVPIHTRSRIVSWKRNGMVRLETDRGFEVECEQAVFACNDPFLRFRYFTMESPYRSYATAFEVDGEEAGKIEPRLQDALYWDTANPYHYVRFATHPDGHGKMLIVGGEDHKTGQCPTPEAAWERLEAWTRLHFPFAGKVLRNWSGQILETLDGLALIGADPKEENQVFLISGDSGMGLTHGTLGGILLGDLLEGKPNAWAPIYDPGRFCWKRLPHYVEENLEAVAQYGRHLLPPAPSGDHPGENGHHGVMVRRGCAKVGLSRSSHGALCEVKTVCPHLGGLVTWNEAEGTWDCPLHGSRFDGTGKVVNGPATTPLSPP